MALPQPVGRPPVTTADDDDDDGETTVITWEKALRYVLYLEQENERLAAERDHWRRVAAAMERREKRRRHPERAALQALADGFNEVK